MPCRGSEPSIGEERSIDLARKVQWLHQVSPGEAEPVAGWVATIAQSTYGDADEVERLTRMFCGLRRAITPEQWREVAAAHAEDPMLGEVILEWHLHAAADRAREEGGADELQRRSEEVAEARAALDRAEERLVEARRRHAGEA